MTKLGESSCRRMAFTDPGVLESMIRKYSDSLVRFAYGYIQDSAAAEDVAADAFAVVFVQGKSFLNENQARTYLYKVARSRAVDYLRRHKHQVPLEDVENILTGEDAAESVHRKLRREAVFRAMQRLPGQYREVLQLMYFDGFTPEETAKILGKTGKQVYNLHSRAKSALRNCLQQEGITYEEL